MSLSAQSLHSSNPTTNTIKPQNKVDIQGVSRLECNNCTECPQFLSVPGHILCAYCGCPPARHQKSEPSLANEQSVSVESRVVHSEEENAASDSESESENDTESDVSEAFQDLSDTESTSSGVSSFHSGRGRRRRWRPAWQTTPPPPRVQRLFDEPPADLDISIANSWSSDDCSANIFVKPDDQLTFHRNPVFQTTDAIRGKLGYSSGLHIWELYWPHQSRGTHPVVGVATADSPLTSKGYKRLVGSNSSSWGWCIKSRNLYHDSRKFRNGVPYPSQSSLSTPIPSYFYMMLDMDRGTLSFQVENDFLGIAFSGLKGKRLYPIVSAVWGHCEVTLRYIGSHEFSVSNAADDESNA